MVKLPLGDYSSTAQASARILPRAALFEFAAELQKVLRGISEKPHENDAEVRRAEMNDFG